MGESNQRKQESAKRSIQRPQTPVFPAETSKPEPLEEYFPSQTTFPWEEELEQENSWSEDLPLNEYTSHEYTGPGYKMEGRIESVRQTLGEQASSEWLEKPQTVKQIPQVNVAQEYALQLTREHIWQGILWSEILNPPKCKGRSR